MRASAELLTSRSFRIQLPGGLATLAHSRGFTRHASGGVTWVGTFGDDQRLQVLAASEYGVVGRVEVESRSYYVEPIGGGWHLVQDVVGGAVGRDSRDVRKSGVTTPANSSANKGASSGSTNIELLILYTPQAAAGIIDEINAAETAANTSLSASWAVGSVSAAVVEEWNFPEQSDTEALVHALASDPAVAARRDATQTDLVGLVVSSTNGCGYAEVVGASASNGFFVVKKSCAVSNHSLIHEVGHLVGGRHNVEADPITTPYAHGHGFWDKFESGFGTIMALDGSRKPYWSNPDLYLPLEDPAAIWGSATADMATLWTQRSGTMAAFRTYSGPTFTVDLLGPDEMKWKEECTFSADAYWYDPRDPSEEDCPSCTYNWYQRALGAPTWTNTNVTTSSIWLTLLNPGGVEIRVDVDNGNEVKTVTEVISESSSPGCWEPPGAKWAGEVTPSSFAFHPPYPNPALGQVELTIDVPKSADIQITVYDALGREVARPHMGAEDAGTLRVSWGTDGLAPGVYSVRVAGGGWFATRTVTLLR